MADRNDDKFINIIKNRIAAYSNNVQITEEGTVLSVSDGIAIVSGLANVMLNEIVQFENNTQGIALNLEANYVGVVVLGPYQDIHENSRVKRMRKVVSVPVGDELLGRIVDPLGQPIDGGVKFDETIKVMPIEKIAPGVMTRKPVYQTLETGILMIDSMFPIGKGQRELIIGDRQTGKSSIAINTIINQKGKNVKCVYVSIGQKKSTLAQIIRSLETCGAMKYTTVVASTASDLPALLYLAPYSGVTIAEEWMSKGEDVLIVYDDLTKHAVSYRTISLLLRRPPGREAYPGDIFYLHSRLLERACKLDEKYGGGSITALPIIETQAGDISAYVPTNVISITDGQLFLQANLFNLNQRPAIDAGLSVSRVGSAAQFKAVKQVSGSLKIDLSQYYEMSSFAQFGSDLDESTLNIIEHGKRINELVKQPNEEHFKWIEEVVILFLIKEHLIRYIPLDKIADFKNKIVSEIKVFDSIPVIEKELSINKDSQEQLLADVLNFLYQYVKKIDNYDVILLEKLTAHINNVAPQIISGVSIKASTASGISKTPPKPIFANVDNNELKNNTDVDAPTENKPAPVVAASVIKPTIDISVSGVEKKISDKNAVKRQKLETKEKKKIAKLTKKLEQKGHL